VRRQGQEHCAEKGMLLCAVTCRSLAMSSDRSSDGWRAHRSAWPSVNIPQSPLISALVRADGSATLRRVVRWRLFVT
jgi:hypothetical protein